MVGALPLAGMELQGQFSRDAVSQDIMLERQHRRLPPAKVIDVTVASTPQDVGEEDRSLKGVCGIFRNIQDPAKRGSVEKGVGSRGPKHLRWRVTLRMKSEKRCRRSPDLRLHQLTHCNN